MYTVGTGTRISELPEAKGLEEDSVFPIVTEGQTEKATIEQLRNILGEDPDAYEVKYYDKATSFPPKGEDNKLYITMDDNKIYRWDIITLRYIEISSDIVIDTEFSETSMNAIANKVVTLKLKDIEERITTLEETEEEINRILDDIESQI